MKLEYIGAWEHGMFSDLPLGRLPQGPFFRMSIELEGENFRGTMVDNNGTAEVRGAKFDGGSISLTKKYSQGAIEKGGREEAMHYSGRLVKKEGIEYAAGLITSETMTPIPFVMRSV